ncbi:flagellar hook protein FlgE [Acidocella aromatica]|uniref:Flagellar hook protein FlgE n=1 Tax=Acidocella aromatica TaxID=1303579 RepID=A0A840VFR3_9PROT|nr:flagellar hook protein FlgE [Acidocella aromatica]MBB5373737.1 flagellar hook protein FlgE [Acidocella aromatica]
MTMQTALSGLLGAQTGLNTVSNDLANASTTAFKSQTALFEDVYPANATNMPGIGTATEGISSDLTQGNLTATGNSLDAAIQGNGYFIVSNNGTQQYTRDGAFQLSSNGTLETLNGATVQGYAATTGGALSGTLGPVTINTGSMAANATSNLGVTLSLNSGDTTPTTTPFSASDPSSYNETTSVVTYDSLGNANKTQLYFANNGSNQWTVYAQPQLANGTSVGTPQTLTTLNFTSSGALSSGSPATLSANWGNGSAASNVNMNFTGSTLAAQSFSVAGLTNDGYAAGSYSGTTISSNGSIKSTYSNGQTVSAGKLALANFINAEGLTPATGNLYTASSTSGQPVVNTPGTGLAGTLAGGELESSNASTSSLLVSLIQYQQAYQANTSVIQTEQSDAQRLVQI